MDQCPSVCKEANKGKPLKMESTRDKNRELGRPELPAESVMLSEPPGLGGDYFWCWGIKVTKIKPFRKIKSKWSHNKYNVGMLHQKHNTTSNLLNEKNASAMGQKENEKALFPMVSCTSQKHQK